MAPVETTTVKTKWLRQLVRPSISSVLLTIGSSLLLAGLDDIMNTRSFVPNFSRQTHFYRDWVINYQLIHLGFVVIFMLKVSQLKIDDHFSKLFFFKNQAFIWRWFQKYTFLLYFHTLFFQYSHLLVTMYINLQLCNFCGPSIGFQSS